MTLNMSRKFCSVGTEGHIFGGNTHSSSSGLKALPMMTPMGNAMNSARASSTRNMAAVPARERLTRRLRLRAFKCIHIFRNQPFPALRRGEPSFAVD